MPTFNVKEDALIPSEDSIRINRQCSFPLGTDNSVIFFDSKNFVPQSKQFFPLIIILRLRQAYEVIFHYFLSCPRFQPELPTETCKEIKTSEFGQVVSGKYWLSGIKPGMAVLAYCDMETEGKYIFGYVVDLRPQCARNAVLVFAQNVGRLKRYQHSSGVLQW